MLDNLLNGLLLVLTFKGMLVLTIGVILGILVGAMPGIGPAPAVAIMLTFTYTMRPELALILLVSVYLASQYGGCISAITIGVPGDAGGAATVLDGYEFTKKGIPGKALGISLYSSVIGGFIGLIVLIFMSEILVKVALRFGPAEYFALGFFGLSIVSSITGRSVAKGFVAMFFGLFVAMIGLDPLVGCSRMTFGIPYLEDGLPLIPVLLGLFAVSEVFLVVEKINPLKAMQSKDLSDELPTLREMRKLGTTICRSSLIGIIIGAIPGAGASIASFVAYNEAKRFSKHPEEFGKGAPEGVAAPESANNASVTGALIPLLTLGIPGSATAAVLLGALMLHGLRPGTQLFTTNADVLYAMYWGLMIGNIIMLFIGVWGRKLWVKVVSAPSSLLMPLIFGLAVIGSYSINNDTTDVVVMFIFGLVGYLFKKKGLPVAATVIGFILADMVEMSFRRALTMSDGNLGIFFTQPIALLFIVLGIFSFVVPLMRERMKRKAAAND